MNEPKYDLKLYMEAGFCLVRRLDSGLEIGIMRMLFTWDLCFNINPNSMSDIYECRYMYETAGEAVEACSTWDGDGHPPGKWIKRKGIYPEISNPNFKTNEHYQ